MERKDRRPLRATRMIAVILLASLTGSGLRAAGGPDEEAFSRRVERAIERGRRAMLGPLESSFERRSTYPMGYLALYLTAALKSGTPTSHPLVIRGMKRLTNLPLRRTYSVACYLFALDAYWQRRVEEAATGEGTRLELLPRQARGEIRERMIRCLEWLVQHREVGLGRWNYGRSSGTWDLSNTQFAVLGLQIGLENELPVSPVVFEEIVEHAFRTIQSSGGRRQLELVFEPDIEELFAKPERTTRARSNRRVSVIPAGWEYSKPSGRPYASMTAAGASNLLVALNGLEAHDRLGPRTEARIRAVLEPSLAWLSTRLPDITGLRASHAFYTLYSLEKVGDLGRIRTIDGQDWYRRGATTLVERQHRTGDWGTPEETAFALLFLTRATRPGLEALAPPEIITGTGQTPTSEDGDLVYVDSLKGFISARQFFAMFLRLRKPALQKVAEEIVSNYPVHRLDELIPSLLLLWGDRRDRVAAFAREALTRITGTRSRDREVFARIYRRSQEVRTLIEARESSPEILESAFRRAEGSKLKLRLISYFQATGAVEMCEVLIDEIPEGTRDYRMQVIAALEHFTGHVEPVPETGARSLWKACQESWRSWWESHRARLLTRAAIQRTIRELQAMDTDAARRKELLEKLVEQGETAVPEIIRMLRRQAYRVEFILALEAITGERRGWTVEAWES